VTIQHNEDEIGGSCLHEDIWKSSVGYFLGQLRASIINILCGDFLFSLLSLFYCGTTEVEIKNIKTWIKVTFVFASMLNLLPGPYATLRNVITFSMYVWERNVFINWVFISDRMPRFKEESLFFRLSIWRSVDYFNTFQLDFTSVFK